MRPALVIVVLCAAGLPRVAADEQFPRGHLYRGPLFMTRDATVVEPAGGLPLRFSDSLLLQSFQLITTVRSNTLRTVPVSAITLRVAFGPTPQGMITYRVRAAEAADVTAPAIRITPGTVHDALRFSIVRQDPTPGLLALAPAATIVFTVERIEGDNGLPIFDNPNAIELLWVALGRPGSTAP
jgi:hypothetical protein